MKNIRKVFCYFVSRDRLIVTDSEGNVLDKYNLFPEAKKSTYNPIKKEIAVFLYNNGHDKEKFSVENMFELRITDYKKILELRILHVKEYWQGYHKAMESMSPFVEKGEPIPDRIRLERDEMIGHLPQPPSLLEIISSNRRNQ